MLRSFRFANHKSFRDEAELLLVPAYDKTRPVAPVAGIFGPNASGKSNLLDALQWMQVAVCTSHWQWEPDRGVPRAPFRLSGAARQAPSHYIVELLVADVRYVYGFEVDDQRVREEWLYTYPRNRRRVIFERAAGGWRFGTHVPRDTAELMSKLTRDNALFLGVAAHSGLEMTLPVYNWFQRDLELHLPAEDFDEPGVLEWLEHSPERRATLVKLLQAADLGITDLRRVGDYGSVTLDELAFVHGPDGTEMPAPAQSRGTLAWLELLTAVLTALERGSVVCVDEIDASLHPHLTARLVGLFRAGSTNPGGAQLLLSTHDPTLLDDEVLSRDEIWFVEKKRDSGGSICYPLTDFHPRKSEDVEGRYLAGGYGAIPLLTGARFHEALETGAHSRAAA